MPKFFGKCMGCFYKYSKCKPSEHRIPRKHKKKLKHFLQVSQQWLFHGMWIDASICEMDASYKAYKSIFRMIGHCQKFNKELLLLKQAAKDAGDEFYLDDKGKLSWYWEYDNGLYDETGLMPFCYNKEDAGETWAYDSLHELWYYLYKEHRGHRLPAFIKSDIELLKFIKQNPPPKDWPEPEPHSDLCDADVRQIIHKY